MLIVVALLTGAEHFSPCSVHPSKVTNVPDEIHYSG